jgi:hypothetical protein
MACQIGVAVGLAAGIIEAFALMRPSQPPLLLAA